jgi:hypothetical protein
MNHARPTCPVLACAALATLLAFAWQWLDVRYNYGGNWTGLFCIGDRWSPPPRLAARNLYRFPNSAGFDGQFYYYIAHDLAIRTDIKQYVDNPPLRWRRILLPAAAAALALGREERIAGAYIFAVLACVFAGTWWLARFFQRSGYNAFWGLTFLCTPAVAVSIDRLTVDIALAALCLGFAYAGVQSPRSKVQSANSGARSNLDFGLWTLDSNRSPAIYALLALAPLARETGLALVAAFVLFSALQKRFRRAALGVLCALPWLAWVLFVRVRLWADATPFFSPVPLSGLVSRTIHPLQFAITGRWLALAAALDYLAVAGVWIALFLVARFIWKRNFGLLELAAIVLALGVAFIAEADVWAQAYGFARTMTPLLLFPALLAVERRPEMPAAAWLAAPLALSVPRIALQIATLSLPIARGLLQ